MKQIDYQIMWDRLIAVVEETGDDAGAHGVSRPPSARRATFPPGSSMPRRGMMAQAVTGTPGACQRHGRKRSAISPPASGRRRRLEGRRLPGPNDPWLGTGHLHDITVVTPVFRKGRHIGYFACTAHVVDIGGRGFGPDGREVYEEGLLIPITKFAQAGQVQPLLIEMIRANVRTPDQTAGDIHSLAACNAAGERRLHEMMDEFGIDDLLGLSTHILDISRKATRAAIETVPDGVYRNEMRVDGYDAPVDMVVTLTVEGDRLRADFTGTSGPSSFGVNVPEVYTRAYACFALKCTIAPDVPNNAGSLEPFEITAPEGSILAARRPAPVSVRHVLGHLVPDVVLGALHHALPDTVPAEGASSLLEHPDRGAPGRRVRSGRGDPDVQLRRHRGAART